jgi:hypothetical protein
MQYANLLDSVFIEMKTSIDAVMKNLLKKREEIERSNGFTIGLTRKAHFV